MTPSTTTSRMMVASAIFSYLRGYYPEILTNIAQVWGLTTTRGLYSIGLDQPSTPRYSLVPRGDLFLPVGTILDGLNSWQVAAIPRVFDHFDLYQEAPVAAYNPPDPVPHTFSSTAEPLDIEEVALLVIFGIGHLNRHVRLNVVETYNGVMARFFAEARLASATASHIGTTHVEAMPTGTNANDFGMATDTGGPVITTDTHLHGRQDHEVLEAAEVLMSFKDL